jgi:hypothetical protein
MGSKHEYWDTTYHFLMGLGASINKLPEHRQMFLPVKTQEIIFQETHKQLCKYNDGRWKSKRKQQTLFGPIIFADFQRVMIFA